MLNIFSLYFEPWHLYFKKHLEQILAAYVSIFWLTFSVNCNPLARFSEMPEVKPLADQPVKACNGTYVAPHTRSAPSSRNSSSSGSGSPPEYQGREDFFEGLSWKNILRYQRGASVPRHKHLGFEHICVLSGSQTDHNGEHKAGTLVYWSIRYSKVLSDECSSTRLRRAVRQAHCPRGSWACRRAVERSLWTECWVLATVSKRVWGANTVLT